MPPLQFFALVVVVVARQRVPAGLEWVELDVWGRLTGKSFIGDVNALREHLLHHHSGVERARVSEAQVAELFLSRVDERIAEKVRSTLITLVLPWGTYRWIPRPVPSPR